MAWLFDDCTEAVPIFLQVNISFHKLEKNSGIKSYNNKVERSKYWPKGYFQLKKTDNYAIKRDTCEVKVKCLKSILCQNQKRKYFIDPLEETAF